MSDSELEAAAETLRFVADAAAERLDRFLAERIESVSRSRLQRWIEAGHVSVNRLPARPSRSVAAGDEIEVRVPPPDPVELVAEAIPIDILYEDDQLIVVNKPAGLVVHPGAGNRTGTLANALLHHFQTLSRNRTPRPGIVHRLDRDTSGVIVAAKTEAAHDLLAAQFKQRSVEKEYRALLYGRLEQREGTIGEAIGRDRRNRLKMSGRSSRLREARTDYRVLKLWSEFSDVAAFPKTGRTHQIRVHFQMLGHPVVGDTLYAGRRLNAVSDPRAAAAIRRLDRFFLHAARLAFEHPVTGKKVEFRAALPSELEDMLARLEQ